MSDEPTIPEIDGSRFDTLFVDGVYLNFKNEYVRCLFFRDVSAPEKMSDGSVKFGDNRREVLQEIRMPYQAADDLRYNLDIGLPLYTTYGDSTVSERTSRFLELTLKRDGGRFIELSYEMGREFWSMDKIGQEKAAAILSEFWDNNKPRFQEITREHPRKVEKTK